MAEEDPHGSRGSTEHHALDYKKEVKRFSSSDILAAYKASARGEKVAALPTLSSRSDDENKRASEPGPAAEEKGKGGEASASSSAPTPAPAAAPSAAGSESLDKSIKVGAPPSPLSPLFPLLLSPSEPLRVPCSRVANVLPS